MDYFVMKPKIDFAFKEMMENEEARKGFLSAFLKIAPEDIKETLVLNPDIQKPHVDEEPGVLDVRVVMGDDTQIDTEIRFSKTEVWPIHLLFYAAKTCIRQIKPINPYRRQIKSVGISILDFILFPEIPSFHSCFHIREDRRRFSLTDQLEFHVLELPKLPKELKEDSDDLLLWAKFINTERKEEFELLAKRNPYIRLILSILVDTFFSREKRAKLQHPESRSISGA